MIQQKHLAKYPTFERTGLDKLTQPGMGTTPGEAIKALASGNVLERMGTFYENEGMPIPNFAMMSKTDRMIELNKYKAIYNEKFGELQKIHDQHKEAILQEKIKAKVNESKQPQPGDAGHQGKPEEGKPSK